VPEAEPEIVHLNRAEEIKLRRLLRGCVNKKKRGFRKSLKRQGNNTFVMISSGTVRRMMEWIEMGGSSGPDAPRVLRWTVRQFRT
jgi:hypothetical protein